MTLACKHVDDVVIGAPYIITEDLIKSLNIQKVITITDTKEDCPKKEQSHVDQFVDLKQFAPELLHEIKIGEPFYNITTETISERVLGQQEAFEAKYNKKMLSVIKYTSEDKKYIEEC